MTDQISEMAKDLAVQNAPWAEGVKWWVVLIEALVLLGLGAFILFVPDAANKTVVELLGLFLLISGLLDAWQGIRGRVAPRALPYHMLSAGSSITVGVIVLLDLAEGFMSIQAAAVVVSIGLIISGIAGLIVWIGGGERGDRNFLNLILPIGLLVLGAVTIFSRLTMGSQVVRGLGIASLVIGALLLVQTFVLYGKQQGKQEVALKQETVSQAAASVSREIDKSSEPATPPKKSPPSDSNTG